MSRNTITVSAVIAAAVVTSIVAAGTLHAQVEPQVSQEEPEMVDEPIDEPPEYAVDLDEYTPPDTPIFDPDELGSEWELMDTSDDGNDDYAVIVDELSRLVRAAMDYSGDGYFDNFYFYEEGVLSHHKIDSNGDQEVDLRVFLVNGHDVAGFEQDTNHDGVFDRNEEYGE